MVLETWPVMLSVIIPTNGVEAPVVATLAALVPGAATGVVRDVVLVEQASSEAIARVADVAGCVFVAGSRAAALVAGAAKARSDWLMFLHAGAIPDPGWIDEVAQFMQDAAIRGQPVAALFRPTATPYGGARKFIRQLARSMTGPSPDQGLVIARAHYDRLGGHDIAAPNAETKLLRQLGRERIVLRSRIRIR